MEGLKLGDRISYLESWTVLDMANNLKCDEIFENERPVHSQIVWDNARALYRDIVGRDSSIADDATNGFSVPVEAKQAPPKGRGIFVLRDVAAGELMWSTKKTARFQDGSSYRKFIFGLEEGVACDVLEWGTLLFGVGIFEIPDPCTITDGLLAAYVQDIGDENLRISVDLDEGCLCNNGSSRANMGCDEVAAINIEGGCKENYFALRDIKMEKKFGARMGSSLYQADGRSLDYDRLQFEITERGNPRPYDTIFKLRED
eukprot:CAMPEP_0172577148 /NCGR_PEP_ID=MMETSP1067-20121228/138086_1 /TAXON_ID=265564 ORGANISM="Thalassiosira punctigera, Strain Tpunct2005C2" /NCGR_SAMPLE_ID=MMETSP1067 /ASSEMBLY_ACC=CAM_ASM_000444 /LENGTH=258 /DNA_ID=CAMNT_0013369833 /DNA_START=186 /DNA_END=964 /DNA_ORIENTATION=-